MIRARRYWAKLRRESHPFRLIFAQLLWRTKLCTLFRFRHNGFVLRFYPSAFSTVLWTDPDSPRDDEDFFARYLRPGDVVVDVGANIGTLSLAASRSVATAGRVISAEPHPRTYRFLCGNLRLNGVRNVTARNMALGRAPGTVRFSDAWSDDQNRVVADGAGVVVEMSTLDVLLAAQQRIHLLKIDVEGYEKMVLEGAGAVLGRTDTVYFESFRGNFAQFGYRFRDVWRLLAARGFTTLRFVGRRRLATVSGDYESEICENLVSVRSLGDFLARTGFYVEDSERRASA
jgi:FkbM family methyltransferase